METTILWRSKCVFERQWPSLITDEMLYRMSALHLQMRRWPCIMSKTVSLRQDVKVGSTVYGSRSAENDCLCCTLSPCKCFFYRWSSQSLPGLASTHLHLIPQNDIMCQASHWQVGREKVSCWSRRQLRLKYGVEITFLDTTFVLLCLDDSFTVRHSLPQMPQNQSNLWIIKLYIGCSITPIIKNEKSQ